MYQKLFIAVMAVTIGVCGSTRITSSQNSVMACWGLMYPRLCYIEGTYLTSDQVKEGDPAELIQTADPEQIVIRLKLLELLSE